MQLLAPLFLLGLGLIALPLWLHRLKTETPERETFASTMFLQQSEDPVHVKRKLRYLLLMALRILFLLLVALAFSRPFWPNSTSQVDTDWNNLHLLVVDTSASMNSDEKQAKARQALSAILDDVNADEAVQLFSMDQSLQKHSEVSLRGVGVLAAFEEIQATDLALDYATMVRAVEALMSAEESANINYQIHFISDFQQSSMPNRFADLIAEPTTDVNYQLFTHNVSDQDAALINLAIDHVEVVGQEARISVRSYVSSDDDSTDTVEFVVRTRLAGQEWQSTEAEIRSADRVTVAIDGFDFLPQQNQLQIELQASDSLDSDNTFYHIVNRSAPEPLLLLTDNPYGASALYISALFSNKEISNQELSGQQSINTGRNFIAQSEAISSFDTRTLNRYSWVLVDDIGLIDAQLADELTGYVREGGSVFFASGPQSESLTSLPIFSLPISQQTDIRQLGSDRILFRSIASVDQSHQALNQLSAWSDLRFERWLTLEDIADSDVLIQLDDGAPLLLEQQLGRGKVMLLTSSLDNQWNNLPVKPIFVALMRNVAQYLSGAELIQPAAYAGDTLKIQGNDIGAGQLIDPEGNAVLALGDQLRSDRQAMNTLGFYQASTAAGDYVIAVNLPPSESDLRTVSPASLEQWQTLAQRDRNAVIADSEAGLSRQDQHNSKLWFWLLLLAALAVLIESLLANFRLANNSRIIHS